MKLKTLGAILTGAAILSLFTFAQAQRKDGGPAASNPFQPPPEASPLANQATNLGPAVNSPFSDIGPVISPDGNALFFTSDRPGGQGGQDIWVSYRKDGVWQEAENLGPPINTSGNEGADCFSIWDNALYFTACDREDSLGGCDIYVSFLIDGDWSNPQNLGPPINTEHNEQNASVSPDGDFIIFTSDRPGGLGGSDLWIAKKGRKLSRLHPGFDPSGRWEEPVNMGPNINTPDWEGVGFLMPDKKTLYFSSRGRGGSGGADIFRSTYSDGEWGPAKNMGDIINTPRDDIYFTLPGSGELAYFSSDMAGGLGGEDIYSIPVPTLIPRARLVVISGQVRDADTGDPVKATVQVIDPANSRLLAEVESDPESGAFEAAVSVGRFEIKVSGTGRRTVSEVIEVREDGALAMVTREFLLPKK